MATKIIAVVGMPGSGKSEAAKLFAEKGYYRVYFGDVTFEEMKRLGLAVNPLNEQTTRERIRKEQGMDAYAKLSLSNIKTGLKKVGKIVIESMYSFEEYKFLKDRFGSNFVVLAIMASPSTRYERLKTRKIRPMTAQECRNRDIAQIDNLHQAGPIAMADFVVINESTMSDLVKSIEGIIQRIH